MDKKSFAFLACIFLYECTLIILILHPSSGHVGLAGAHLLPWFPYTRESQWQDEQRWIYCRLHVIFPFQEEIFHLEPGRVESGKGKCSYDPKLNSVSALISEYHLALALLRHRHGYIPSMLHSNDCAFPFGFFISFYFIIWPSLCAQFRFFCKLCE